MARRITNLSADGTDLWMNSSGALTSAADGVLCSRLAAAARGARLGGDSIDHGLSLLAELRRQGFGVIYVGEPERAAGAGATEPVPSLESGVKLPLHQAAQWNMAVQCAEREPHKQVVLEGRTILAVHEKLTNA